MHAGGGTNDLGEKRNVLIVGVLLLIGSNLSLRSNTQRRVQILRVRQAPVLLYVAGRPKPVMGLGWGLLGAVVLLLLAGCFFSIQYSVMADRGNGVIHRGQKPASRR